MPSICFYFQVHQPFRLKQYDCFKIGYDHLYEDVEKNKAILDRVSEKCYLPANRTILDLIRRHKGKFKVSYSISGTALEQFEKYRPDVLKSFQQLAQTGCVEFLSETYNHSLSFLYSKEEFIRQVGKHKEKIIEHFQQSPQIFRNTELIYNNEIARFIYAMGYKGIICEGLDHILGYRSANFLYHPPVDDDFKCLLKNYRLSDDIAFRFSNKDWNDWPLTASKFAHWVHQAAGNGDVINLFMDYETFGEHQWPETGIFEFLKYLPQEILRHPDFDFKTPSEVIRTYPIRGEYDVHNYSSWADIERDLSAWIGNSLQYDAMERIYSLEKSIKETGDENLIETWAKLLTSDHFYYMCTKYWHDGDVHKYFSHYDTPYDGYINFMNIVTDLEYELELKQQEQRKQALEKKSRLKRRVQIDTKRKAKVRQVILPDA
ncbi:MAG TPA: glycoside hydrolase family 57 protein [Cyclobacteriaceae bacterium]|nr:glycoside hydrolase family 57 protein [Cyclobacteriaceae bacterium]